MRAGLKAAGTTLAVVAALVIGTMLLVSPSDAVSGRSCKDIAVGPGWDSAVQVVRTHSSVTATAPTGYLIDAYCMKVGSGANAAVIVQVNPPAAVVVVDRPT